MIKFLYTKDNILVGEIKYSKTIFHNYKKHSHCMLCFGIVEQGSIIIDFINYKQVFTIDKIVVFNPHQPHIIKNINAVGYYTIYINIDWCSKIQQQAYSTINDFTSINTNIIQYKQLNILCKNIFIKKDNTKDISILLKILKEIIINNIDFNKIDNPSQLTVRIQNYIKSNNNSKLSIDDIAKRFNYNKSYLIRVFKKDMKITPQEFIINQKINIAKQQLLSQTKDNLITISYNNGFYDQSHFNRNFKRIFATTPNSYKKSILYNK